MVLYPFWIYNNTTIWTVKETKNKPIFSKFIRFQRDYFLNWSIYWCCIPSGKCPVVSTFHILTQTINFLLFMQNVRLFHSDDCVLKKPVRSTNAKIHLGTHVCTIASWSFLEICWLAMIRDQQSTQQNFFAMYVLIRTCTFANGTRGNIWYTLFLWCVPFYVRDFFSLKNVDVNWSNVKANLEYYSYLWLLKQ